jgi:hypothetical protein
MLMPVRRILALALVWVASLLVVATIARAQVYPINPLPEPRVVFGPDFGIRIEGEQNGVPVGTVVVKINGKWVEARIGSLPAPKLLR